MQPEKAKKNEATPEENVPDKAIAGEYVFEETVCSPEFGCAVSEDDTADKK